MGARNGGLILCLVWGGGGGADSLFSIKSK